MLTSDAAGQNLLFFLPSLQSGEPLHPHPYGHQHRDSGDQYKSVNNAFKQIYVTLQKCNSDMFLNTDNIIL